MSGIAKRLAREIESFADRMRSSHPLLSAAQAGRVSPPTVVAYLAGVRHLLLHTPIHFDMAQRRAATLGRSDVCRYMEQKKRDEAGHAKWAENDLLEMHRVFGLQEPKPCVTVSELVEYLGKLAQTEPTLYIPYVLFAEYFVVLAGPDWVEALQQRCGIPAKALTSITLHVELDRAHVSHALRELDDLIGEDEDPNRLVNALREAMSQFERFLDEIHEINRGETKEASEATVRLA